MAVQKHNAYYSDEKGKIYYYDKNGNCKDVPPEGFAELERDIIYLSGAISGLPGQVQSDWAEDDASDPSYIKNKPEGLSLSAGDGIGIVEDAGNITVSVTGDYADRDKVEGEIEYLSGAIDNIPQKQSDWEETDTSDPAYILNKPDLSVKLDVSAFDDTVEQINDAFDEVDRRIDEIGSPLVWIDVLSAAEINELSGVKNGWVYTLADDGTITGDDYSIDVRSGDEIAWTSAKNCWQPIGVTKPDNSWKQWSEDHNSSGDNNSVYIGKDLSAENGGIIIGDVGTQIELDGFDPSLTKADNGIVITKAMKDIPSGVFKEYGFDYEYTTRPSGALNFKYNEIEYNETTHSFDTTKITDNTKWAASAANGGIAIGRAVTADFGGIAISPKFNSNNTNFNVLGTSASNEGVAIGEGVAATNGGLAFGKNGLSANGAAIGIGRGGSANNASVLISNDLRQTTAMSGQTYCYYDNNTNQYIPVDRTLGKHYYSPQYLSFNKYNVNTSAFVPITGINEYQFANIVCVLLNEYDGAIYMCSTYPNSTIISGYYDENKVFHEVPRSEVPSSATFVSSYSASVQSFYKYGSDANSDILYTTSFYNYNNYVFKITYDSEWENVKFYSDYRMPEIYNYLITKTTLSGYIDETSLKNAVYDNIYYDDNPRSPTSGKLINESSYIDYLIGKTGESIYLEDIVLTGVSAKFEPNNLATYNGIGIGQNLQAEASIVLNTNGNSYVGEISNANKINSSNRYAIDIETGRSNYYNVLKENTFFDTGIIQSSATQPKAQGESILISPNGRNVYAYGESVLIGRKDTTATSRSIAIGNCQYASNASISIGYADENDNNYGIASAMCNSAYNKAIAIGTSNKSQNCSIVVGKNNNADYDSMAFGKYNTTYGDVYAIGEKNTIYYGKSIVLGFGNTAGSSFESSILGFYNTVYGNSIQASFVGHNNNVSLGSLQGIIAGYSNSANGSSLQCAIIGTNNYCSLGYMQGIEIGHKNYISCGSVRGSIIGVENSASMSNFDAVLIGNRNNFSYGGSDATVIGTNNNANIARGIMLGQQNSGTGNPILIGYGNKNLNSSQDVVVGNSNSASNESFIFGAGNSAFIGGHNIINGIGNNAGNEAIAIGSYNNVTGHSVALGWGNKTVSGQIYDHALMLGYNNSANNNIKELSAKSADTYTFITYPQSELDNAYSQYISTRNAAVDNYAIVFNLYTYIAVSPWGKYIDVVIPKYYYDSTQNALLPYDAYYNPDTYYIYSYDDYDTYVRIQNDIRNGTIPASEAQRYIFIRYTDTFDELKQLVNNCDPLQVMPYYTAYSAASATYYNMYGTNNTYQVSTITANIETNSLIIGTNNKAEHYNSYLFGSYNQSLSAANSAKDDGFTFALGLNNKVGRNYDMAFGYGVLASGGENIAIGAPVTNSNGYKKYDTKALGYKNTVIRSDITGISNISIDTCVSGSITAAPFSFGGWSEICHNSNRYYGSNISYDPYERDYFYICQNNVTNSNISANVHSYFTYNNINDVQSGTFHGSFNHNTFEHNRELMLSTNYTSDGIEENYIGHSLLSADFDEAGLNIINGTSGNILARQCHDNLIYNSNIDININREEYRGFSNNFLQKSTVSASARGLSDSFFFHTTAVFNTPNRQYMNNSDVMFFSRYETDESTDYCAGVIYSNITAGEGFNFLFGTSAKNLHASVSFSDPYGPDALIYNCARVFNFGDNTLEYNANIFNVGENSYISGVQGGNIFGHTNVAVSNSHLNTSDYLDIIGNSNLIDNSASEVTLVQYNSIFGSHNNMNISADNKRSFTNNIILGSINSYQYISTLYGQKNVYEIRKIWNSLDYDNYKYNICSFPASIREHSKVGAPTKACDRNIIIGSYSVISNFNNDSVIIGSNNIIHNTLIQDDPETTACYSNNYALGSYNLLSNGSNQVAIGTNNLVSGYNATAFGEGLIANTSQVVIGRMNEELPGTNGLSAAGVDSTSGALFIVGNGRHVYDSYADADVERSNAMIVSADGTVSATKFAMPNIPDLAATITNIQSDIGDIETALDAIINGSN